MTKYAVKMERDESGAWIVSVPAVRGCHTYGRTLEQARERIREALSLWVDDADDAELVEHIAMPTRARRLVRSWIKARDEAESSQRKAQVAARVAARQLRKWVSYRDVGSLMELSRQRVQQIVVAGGAGVAGEAGARPHARPARADLRVHVADDLALAPGDVAPPVAPEHRVLIQRVHVGVPSPSEDGTERYAFTT